MKIRVTAKNYHQEVVECNLTVLVEFFAAWCSKCAMMEDVVEDIAWEYEGRLKVCQIEIEESEALATEFDVEVVPTFIVFKRGQPIAVASGVLGRDVLRDIIEV